MRRGSFFHSVTSILQDLAHRYGIETKLLEWQLRRRWPEIAGEVIAAHTRPDQIRYKKLYLLVESSVWLQHLTFLKPTLIEKIHAAARSQVVTDIVLRVGEILREDQEVRRSTAEVDPRTANSETRTDLLKEAEARAAAVTDPELRARLTALMAEAFGAARPQPPGSAP